MVEIISEFRGNYRFLSNSHLSDYLIAGVTYPSVEHYYQSQKCADLAQRGEIISAKGALLARQLGKKCIMKKDFDKIKLEVMEKGIMAKFGQDNELLEKLLATNDALLEEGNNWNDLHWGVDITSKQGQNHLGKY